VVTQSNNNKKIKEVRVGEAVFHSGDRMWRLRLLVRRSWGKTAMPASFAPIAQKEHKDRDMVELEL
jgi:hypothetical protein